MFEVNSRKAKFTVADINHISKLMKRRGRQKKKSYRHFAHLAAPGFSEKSARTTKFLHPKFK